MNVMAFLKERHSARSRYAYAWLILGVVFLTFMLWFAKYSSLRVMSNGTWTNRELGASLSLVFLLIAARLMHALDEMGHGFGVRHVYHDLHIRHRVDDSVISGVLSRESIQGAITLGILASLVTSIERPEDLQGFFRNPRLLFPSTIAAALGVSVITTLAAILCYDYSSRFDWPEGERNSFISKGHRLGMWGFYTLMWSLAAVTALKSNYLCIVTALIVFCVMWYYYFFPIDHVKLPGYHQPDLSKANLQGKALDTINLEAVNLSEANLQNASLQRARLAKATLTDACLDGAKLQFAHLAGATLTGASLKGADLSDADVTQEQIDSAKGDTDTKLSKGLVRPSAWTPAK
jgi:hypothetical protein